MKKLLLLFAITHTILTCCKANTVTIAILAKEKAHTLELYLECIEAQTWPKDQTYLYIRTNNNNDNTADILRDWVEKVRNQYLDIFFDDTNLPIPLEKYAQHEWNCERFKALGKIRQESIDWAISKGSHYFVADCDNFIIPCTLEQLMLTNLPIVAPLLNSNCAYSNFHDAIDENGYLQKDACFYLPLVNRSIKGLVEVPVVHCTYLIRNPYLPFMSYDDESYRYEYVIFSDTARKNNIPQYLDTRLSYGYLSMAETKEQFNNDSHIAEFIQRLGV